MITSIMQPYLFPYIGYWQLIYKSDNFVIYDDVNFIKGGWINRNYILVNKQKHLFTLQLIGASPNKKINEIKTGNNKSKILKTIELNYKKAPYFNDVFPVIKDIVLNKEENLSKYIIYSIKQLLLYMDIKTNLYISSKIKKNNNLKGQDKVIEICKKLNTTTYINPVGGIKLYDRNQFKQNGLNLYFTKAKSTIKYKQFNKMDFISNLSIIDIIMFNNKNTIKYFLNEVILL